MWSSITHMRRTAAAIDDIYIWAVNVCGIDEIFLGIVLTIHHVNIGIDHDDDDRRLYGAMSESLRDHVFVCDLLASVYAYVM